ncbi:MAG TPA: arginine--tRNA ligase, partial [Gemmatimonadota bacterium]|nr:arginine--tRNA ligase [Gemmatimonadota bacterium]
MRPRDELRARLTALCLERGWPVEEVAIERPNDRARGDWASPVALALARPLRRAPREIASELAAGLALDPARWEDPEVAGAGFLNFRLARPYLQDAVRRLIESPATHLRSERLAGRRINVEFVSSNPTGPLHVGHARNAALGDGIAALLA